MKYVSLRVCPWNWATDMGSLNQALMRRMVSLLSDDGCTSFRGYLRPYRYDEVLVTVEGS